MISHRGSVANAPMRTGLDALNRNAKLNDLRRPRHGNLIGSVTTDVVILATGVLGVLGLAAGFSDTGVGVYHAGGNRPAASTLISTDLGRGVSVEMLPGMRPLEIGMTGGLILPRSGQTFINLTVMQQMEHGNMQLLGKVALYNGQTYKALPVPGYGTLSITVDGIAGNVNQQPSYALVALKLEQNKVYGLSPVLTPEETWVTGFALITASAIATMELQRLRRRAADGD